MSKDGLTFKYPSYVQDIMGHVFRLWFGPFRWVCASGKRRFNTNNKIACDVLERLKEKAPKEIQQQMQDNMD